MADVLVLGAGPVGLATATLLARRGFAVTVLDADAHDRPQHAQDAWDRWNRGGVAQFRQAHLFLPGGYQVLRQHLPEVIEALVSDGGRHIDFTALAPPTLVGQEELAGAAPIETVTARRPVLEHALADVAESAPGVLVRRGVEVEALTTGPSVVAGAPHVTGVRTASGEHLEADVVIDVTGRSSALPRRLVQAGARPPEETAEPAGFVYCTRFFRSRHGTTPTLRAPLLTPMGSFSVLTLPSDNDTWCVTVFASAADRAMRALRDTSVFDRIIAACPLHAHWLEGEPISAVNVMTSRLGRRRTFRVDGSPVSTGLLAVGDAWAFTNPSLGRGITLGLRHAVCVAESVAQHLGDPAALTEAWLEATEDQMGPWYDATLAIDRARLAEMEAHRSGAPLRFDPDDRRQVVDRALNAAAMRDAEIFHAYLEMQTCLALPRVVLGRPGFLDRVMGVAGAEADDPPPVPGPDRVQLLDLLESHPVAAAGP